MKRMIHTPAQGGGGGEQVPNLAPLVDVIMVLLIFFLLGASLDVITEGMLQTELDASSGPGGAAKVSIVPTVEIALEDVGEGEGAIVHVLDEVLTDEPFVALRELLARHKRLGADTDNPVIIGAGMSVRWRFVVQAMDAAVRAGFNNIQFAVSFNDRIP